MTTPRFSHDFWSKRRIDLESTVAPVSAVPQASRMAAIDEVVETPYFNEAGVPMLEELEAEGRTNPLHADGPWRVISEWRPGLNASPQSLFVPEHYEPKYAYPLLVWLTNDNQPCDLSEVMPEISTRNFFGLAFPVPKSTPAGGPLSPAGELPGMDDGQPSLLEALKAAVLEVRRTFHIHSERIYLAGVDADASSALDLVLQKPEWFGGAVVLGGRVPSVRQALHDFANLQGKRILLGASKKEDAGSADALQQTGKLLHSAGMDVQTQSIEDGQETSRRTLNLINRWIMEGICSPA